MQINIVNNLDKNGAALSDIAEKAILSGVVKSGGALTISKSGLGIELVFGDSEGAIYISNLFKKLTQKELSIKKSNQTIGKNQINTYTLIVNAPNTKDILISLGILDFSDENAIAFTSGIPKIIDTIDLFRCYLRGILIGKSKISVPEKDSTGHVDSNSYRLEIRPIDGEVAKEIVRRLDDFDINLRIKGEDDNVTLFSMESETICDILTFIGACKAAISIQSMRVEKGAKLQAIRETNCEMANITKTVDLTEKLRQAVMKLQDRGQYDSLGSQLRDTCAIKLENTEISLEQIAAELGISKSAVNHRFRKIIEMAKDD